MVQISRVSFQLPLVTKRLCPHLNEMYIWFRSPPHMSILSSSSLQFIVVFIVISCTCLLEMLIFAIVFLPSLSLHLSFPIYLSVILFSFEKRFAIWKVHWFLDNLLLCLAHVRIACMAHVFVILNFEFEIWVFFAAISVIFALIWSFFLFCLIKVRT